MIRELLVLGGGSAGLLVANTLKRKLPQLNVRVVRSKEIGIIGVGEGTTLPVVAHLHGYLGIDQTKFHSIAHPTWKLGVRFLWGPRKYFDYGLSRQLEVRFNDLPKMPGYYCDQTLDFGFASALMTHNTIFPRRKDGKPHVTRDPAYHLENIQLVEFLERYAQSLGVNLEDDTVAEVKQDESGVTGLVLSNGRVATADLYVDCSGFRSVLLGQALKEPYLSFKSSLFCDRSLVGGWERQDEPIKPYTTAETMNSGWCWQIEHEHRINRGYVYSSDFISDDEAETEFRSKNPKIGATRIVKFLSGRYQRAWVKNVVAIGNALGFVEPLESSSLAAICLDAFALTESLRDTDFQPRPTQIEQYSRRSAITAELIRRFLAVHYKFNTRLQTPFWRECVEKTDLAGAEEFVEFYKENGPSTLWQRMVLDSRDPFGFEGYLSMMVGMNVPYTRSYTPTDREMQTWNQLQQRFQSVASGGVSVKESLKWVRSPGWQWPQGLYTET